jgi:hypothetical protein
MSLTDSTALSSYVINGSILVSTTTNFNADPDLTSQTYGNTDGYTLCGLRSYTLSGPASFGTYLTINANQNGVPTSNNLVLFPQITTPISYSPCLDFTITSSLASFTNITLTTSFQVCIYPCKPSDFV